MQELWLSVSVNPRTKVQQVEAPYPYHKTTLPNGVRVVTGPMTGVKSGTLIISYAVGSRYEPAPISGVSHFLEHMLFKGT
jgi:predicted Zn-dependent peptidase